MAEVSCLAPEKLLHHFVAISLDVGRHLSEDGAKRAYTQRSVPPNGDVVLASLLCAGEADVATGLSRDLVAEAAKEPGEVRPREVARQLHAEMTSSFTW